MHEVLLLEVAAVAQGIMPKREQKVKPKVRASRGTPSPRSLLPRADELTERISRPCIRRLIREGAPQLHRHNLSLLLRAELSRAAYSAAEALWAVLHYARQCTPAWEEDDARRDVTANWGVTDTVKAHVCPGRGDPSVETHFLHKHYCVGKELCAGDRLRQFAFTWQGCLSSNEAVLYMNLVSFEIDYSLRPGDIVHTTVFELCERTGLREYALNAARKALRDRGLIGWRRRGRGHRRGTHTEIWRVIPMPVPSADGKSQEVVTDTGFACYSRVLSSTGDELHSEVFLGTSRTLPCR